MLKIKFYPDSDIKILKEPLLRYNALWKKEGKKIVKEIEKKTGLKFKEKNINAVVFLAKLPSRSHPLSLKANLSDESKLAYLIHELCHRILAANGVQLLKSKFKTEEEKTFEVHKVLDLILYDVWKDLYGDSFAKKSVEEESNIKIYKKAWRWALSKSRKERLKIFFKLRKTQA